jgi:hypothetical protein
MSYRVGDTIFTQSSAPATIIARDEHKGTAKYDKDFSAFQVNARHGILNGLEQEGRAQFNAIMDEVSANKDNDLRVETLRNKIEELSADPKNFRLTQYLDGEVRHLMNVKGVKPRFFSIDESKAK